jgi:hypothetical protein
MDYTLLKFFHILGAILIGSGLIGVWITDLRARQLVGLETFAEAVRAIAVFYDGLVIPGAMALGVSGAFMIARSYGGWSFVHVPWLAGMVALFLFEFVEGNTITRRYFTRLRRLTQEALDRGRFTPELRAARGETVATFAHFLDLPMLFVIVLLGAMQPASWTTFLIGASAAVATATVLTVTIPKLYPWTVEAVA